MRGGFSLLAATLLIFLSSTQMVKSEDIKVKITKDIPYVDVDVMGKSVRIMRIQDPKYRLKNSYTKTSRPCPPFCIMPYKPIKGVKTIGELDLLNFLKNDVSENSGILVDARMPKWYMAGTIPGAVNIPFSILSPSKTNPYLVKILPLLGAEQKSDGSWDFSKAQKMVIFDNGPWCQQGYRALKHLIEIGYPKDKLFYYRGGMQYWQILGLTTLKPEI
ncbi:MAG: rhodanese-like domain-containing protein [Epsilonproteobacteria bacterium]|nr:rhodanese-like domain-containing protein [Campylobacterota bacterium]